MIRPRRNRKNPAVRSMLAETHLSIDHLIYPLFIVDGKNRKEEISSMPNMYRWSLDLILNEIEECTRLGISKFVLFPAVDDSLKNKMGTYSYAEDNFYLTAANEIKKRFPEILLMSDVALDPYSSDGHDGIVENGIILNDDTIVVLEKMSLAQAQAGFDIIGPSDMMDGRVGAIRNVLDKNDFTDISIMSYCAKYASAYYGPFRDALDSTPKFGDKKTYQLDPANKREALLEADLDTSEGADFLMVKPALAYLDIINDLSNSCLLPITAYNVSGEYAMICAAAEKGWLNYSDVMTETLLSIRRAGASGILTYFAKDFAQLKK